MKRFSISDIEILTGIKAHTLRIWELRYNFFTSKRSETNIRYYDDEDLRVLLNIATLNQHGFKISKISKMLPAEIDEQVNTLVYDQYNFGIQAQILSNAVLRLDEYDFQEKLKACIKELGFKSAMHEVVFPFLRKIEFMRQVKTLTVCHEQFAVHHVSNKIITETSKLSFVKALNGSQYLLFLPYAEENEVTLLYLKYLIKEKGNEILYLGGHVSLKELAVAIAIYQPDFAISNFKKTRGTEEINTIINKIIETKSDLTLVLIGTKLGDKSIVSPHNLKILQDISDFVKAFDAGEFSITS